MKTPTINSRVVKLEVLKGTATRTSVNAVESRTTSLESDVATLTQGIQDAVSTHNASADAHADIRTALAGKQDSLTISDVGEAMLALATPSGQKIPRVNADGSVVLINVPSGDGVGGSSWYASDDGPPGVDISLSWVSDGDANGVVYLAGSTLGNGSFTNPSISGGPLAMLRSSDGDGNASQLTDRAPNVSYSADIPNSWICCDLGAYALGLKSYSLRHQSSYNVDHIRTWRLQGSNMVTWSIAGVGAAEWVDIDVRSNDTTISAVDAWGHWSLPQQAPSYRYIRLLQDGPNSAGRYYLTVAEWEFYGTTSATIPRPAGSTGWARNSELIDDATAWMPYYATSALTDGTPIFGTAYDVASAVSTHNTAPDSHADLRTLIGDRALSVHQHARTDLPWVTEPGAALLTSESASAQRTALGMTAWAVAPWTDGTTSDIPEGAQLYFTNARADARADARIAAQKGQADGLAPLDAGGKVPSANLPDSIAQADDAARLGGQLPSYYAQAGHAHTFAGLTSKPTTLAGYGITDAAAASHTHSGYETAIGNPSANGYLLSSTSAGVRSWVAPYSHPATHAQSVIDSSSGWVTTALAGKQAAGSYLTTTGTAADSAKLGGVAASGYSQTSHTHNYAGSSSPGGAATTALACTGNAATATTAASCTGNSATATTASSCSGNAATATKLATPRTLTIGSKANTFDGSADKAWTLADIGTAAVAHGTWTPILTADVAPTGVSISQVYAHYTKIGAICILVFGFYITSKGTGWSGRVRVAGLPYLVSANYTPYGRAGSWINVSGALAAFYAANESTLLRSNDLLYAAISDGGYIQGAIIYETM